MADQHTRRSILRGAGVVATLATGGLAGCTRAAFNNSKTATETGDGSESATASFQADLESKGVAVDDVQQMLGETMVHYFYDEKTAEDDVRAIAETFVDHRGITTTHLFGQAWTRSYQERGDFDIDKQWATWVATGDLSRDAYIDKVESTWSGSDDVFGGGSGGQPTTTANTTATTMTGDSQ